MRDICEEMEVDGTDATTYSYDAYGRFSSLTNPFSETTSVTYDSAGRVNRKDFGSGVYEAFSYDERSRPELVLVKNSSNTEIDRKEYVWDAASRVTSAKEGGYWSTYEYDAIDQLTEEEKPGLSYLATYTYDANGNRLTRTVNSVTETYAYDAADKLLDVTVNSVAVKEFTYDAAGRTTAVETSAGTTSLAYDYEGRVTSITYSNTSSDAYGYNGLGARASTSGTNGSRTFLRAGLGVTAPVLGDGTADYTPGVSRTESTTTTFAHAGLKNTSTQSAEDETVAATKVYDAFGNEVSTSGTWSGPFGYAGNYGYHTDGSGLEQVGHRYMDGALGRFLTRDPVAVERNDYVYAANAPSFMADQEGTESGKWLKAGLKIWLGIISWGTDNNTLPGDDVYDAPRPGYESSDDHIVRNEKPRHLPKPLDQGGKGKPPKPELPTKQELKNILKNVGKKNPPRWMRVLKKFGKWGPRGLGAIGWAIVLGDVGADVADKWDDPYEDAYQNIRMPAWVFEDV